MKPSNLSPRRWIMILELRFYFGINMQMGMILSWLVSMKRLSWFTVFVLENCNYAIQLQPMKSWHLQDY